MGYIMEYILDLLAPLSLISPCYILSVFFVRTKKPLIGGALALVKFFLTIRAAQIWELMLRSSGKIGWQMFGFGYSPVFAVFFMSMLAIGVICIALNVFVFFKKAMIPTAQA